MPRPITLKPCSCPNLGFTIGADPELAFRALGFPVHAESFIQSIFPGKYSGQDMGVNIQDAGNLGNDGHNSTGELRPLPGHTPAEVADHIQNLLQALVDASTGLVDADTRSITEPIGGHIHFSVPDCLKGGLTDDNDGVNNKKIRRVLSRVMTCYAPLLGAESKETGQNRGGCYGSLADYRINNPSLGVKTVEIRGPSGEWMTTKKLATSTLAFMATVYHEAIFHPESFKEYLKGMVPAEMGNLDAFKHLRATSPRMFSLLKREIFRAVKHFGMYPKFASEIDYLENTSRIVEDKQAVQYNALSGWNLSIPAKDDNKEKQVVNCLMPCISGRGRTFFSDDAGLYAIKTLIYQHALVTKRNFSDRFSYVFGMSESNSRTIGGPYLAEMNKVNTAPAPKITCLDEKSTFADPAWQKDLALRSYGRLGYRHCAVIGIPFSWRSTPESITAHKTDILAVAESVMLQPIPATCKTV